MTLSIIDCANSSPPVFARRKNYCQSQYVASPQWETHATASNLIRSWDSISPGGQLLYLLNRFWLIGFATDNARSITHTKRLVYASKICLYIDHFLSKLFHSQLLNATCFSVLKYIPRYFSKTCMQGTLFFILL